jgi:hypothetical protein
MGFRRQGGGGGGCVYSEGNRKKVDGLQAG